MSDLPRPALATLSHVRRFEDGWVYERKLDGERCLAEHTGARTRPSTATAPDSPACSRGST